MLFRNGDLGGLQLEELHEDCSFQPSQDKEFNTPACAYNLSSSEPSHGVCLCSVYKDGVSFACCSACTKQYGFCFSVCDNPATHCEKMAVHKYCLCGTHRNRWTALKVNSRGDSGLFYVRLIFDQQMAPWTCFTNWNTSVLIIHFPAFSLWMAYWGLIYGPQQHL